METTRVILDYIRVLAWPLAFVVAILVFRNPIGSLFRRMKSAELLGMKTDFAAEMVAALGEPSKMADVQNQSDSIVFANDDEIDLAPAPGLNGMAIAQAVRAVFAYGHYLVAVLRQTLDLPVMASADPTILATALREVAARTNVPPWVDLAETIERLDILVPNDSGYPEETIKAILSGLHVFAARLRATATATLVKNGKQIRSPVSAG